MEIVIIVFSPFLPSFFPHICFLALPPGCSFLLLVVLPIALSVVLLAVLLLLLISEREVPLRFDAPDPAVGSVPEASLFFPLILFPGQTAFDIPVLIVPDPADTVPGAARPVIPLFRFLPTHFPV